MLRRAGWGRCGVQIEGEVAGILLPSAFLVTGSWSR